MLFGIPGMLVVPALSMLVLMVSTYLICLKFDHKWLGILLAGFFSFSLTINRWMYINTTDSLLVAITSGFVLLLIYFRGQTTFYLYAAGLTFFAGLVRFSLMQFLGISLLLFLLKKKKLLLKRLKKVPKKMIYYFKKMIKLKTPNEKQNQKMYKIQMR
jgi:hypothetical protein